MASSAAIGDMETLTNSLGTHTALTWESHCS